MAHWAVCNRLNVYKKLKKTWVPSGFSGYIWLKTKIVLKQKQTNMVIIRLSQPKNSTIVQYAFRTLMRNNSCSAIAWEN